MIDALGDRMKGFYEDRYKLQLPRRTNVLIRVDGRAFHTFTKGFRSPFDEGLMNAMNIACLELCKEAQGAKIGFVQSDEISIVLTDYDTLTTGAWFDYDQQKLASVSASIVTRAFNREIRKYFNATESPVREAEFDGRCWAMPEKEEVVNYFVWRQKDTTQNAISAAARCIYSSKQLDGKNSAQKQEMMFQKGINWNDYPIGFKRGRAVKKFVTGSNFTEDPVLEWKIDHAIPIFTEDRDYIKQTLPIPLT